MLRADARDRRTGGAERPQRAEHNRRLEARAGRCDQSKGVRLLATAAGPFPLERRAADATRVIEGGGDREAPERVRGGVRSEPAALASCCAPTGPPRRCPRWRPHSQGYGRGLRRSRARTAGGNPLPHPGTSASVCSSATAATRPRLRFPANDGAATTPAACGTRMPRSRDGAVRGLALLVVTVAPLPSAPSRHARLEWLDARGAPYAASSPQWSSSRERAAPASRLAGQRSRPNANGVPCRSRSSRRRVDPRRHRVRAASEPGSLPPDLAQA